MSKAQMVGWSHSHFGKSEAPTTQALMGEVVAPALEHAGIGAESVDGVSAVGDANSEEGIVQTTTTTVSYAQR